MGVHTILIFLKGGRSWGAVVAGEDGTWVLLTFLVGLLGAGSSSMSGVFSCFCSTCMYWRLKLFSIKIILCFMFDVYLRVS